MQILLIILCANAAIALRLQLARYSHSRPMRSCHEHSRGILHDLSQLSRSHVSMFARDMTIEGPSLSKAKRGVVTRLRPKSSKDVLTLDDRGRKFIEETLKDILEKLEVEAQEAMFDPRASSDLQRDGRGIHLPESSALYEDEILNGVIRVYCTHSEPNFNIPWQRKKQESSTSSGFVITQMHKTNNGKTLKPYIITNAHSVEYGSIIQVKKRQSEKKYLAKALAGWQ